MRAARMIRVGFVVLAAPAGCGRVRPAPVTRAWEIMGAVLTAAAWGPDTGAVDRALARAIDAVRAEDSTVADSAARALGRTVARVSGAGPALAATAEAWLEVTARGVALDRAARALAETGSVDSAVFDFGGLALFYGGVGRPVGIPDPDDAFRPIARLRLPGSSVPAGARGIVSLRTATPDPDAPRRPRAESATAVAGSAAEAALWSVALLQLGCDRALAVAERVAVGLVCVDTGRRVRWSPDLRGRVAAGASDFGAESVAPAPAPAPAPGRAGAPSGSTRRWSGPDSSP